MPSLDRYRTKRDFAQTPEPAGTPKKARRKAGPRRFVVQKHAARRLHYDFRLELDGVLKSWAVPKGPSLDPGERRLAIHVEDHPLEYGDFEGIIPAGQYGGGTVLLWDRGVWTPLDDDPGEALARGRLHFELDGERLHGRWTLVRRAGRSADGDQDAWFLIKGRDEHARRGDNTADWDDDVESVTSGRTMPEIARDPDRVWQSQPKAAEQPKARRKSAAALGNRSALKKAPKGPLLDSPPPLLATPERKVPDGDRWLHEIKYDGYRILARIDKAVVLRTRNAKDWTARFPEIATALRGLRLEAALLDGEIVQFEPSGRSSFEGLQQALTAGRTARLTYQVFDLLHLDGHDLRSTALEDRKALLRDLLSGLDGPHVRYSDHVVGNGPSFFEKACSHGLEGIISKRADGRYRSGRSGDWLKIKCENREEFLIVGFTEPAGARAGFGALLLGYYDGAGDLRYAGRCGTGFGRALLLDLRRRLDRLARKTPPVTDPPKQKEKVAWVTPSLIAEIRYTEWTADGVLRHPAFLGLRSDKAPNEVVRDPPGEADPGKAEPPLAAQTDSRHKIAGVTLTHPDRSFYPPDRITKLDLARYCRAVAEHALPHMRRRVLSLVRCPDGISGSCFFQKHEMPGFPPEIRRIAIDEQGRRRTCLYVEDLSGLVALVQMGVLEVHVWGSTLDALDRPDRIVFDLDPDEGLGWDRVTAAAIELRDVLAQIGLQGFAKTTGGKGLHVVVPIRPELGWDDVKSFTRAVAEILAHAAPDRYTASLVKKARRGRIFIDYLRNGRGATAVAAFSTRARPGATVSVPVSWREVERGIRSDAFTIRNAPKRLRALKRDPWAGFDADQRLVPILRKLRS